jgi:hypothetical protein
VVIFELPPELVSLRDVCPPDDASTVLVDSGHGRIQEPRKLGFHSYESGREKSTADQGAAQDRLIDELVRAPEDLTSSISQSQVQGRCEACPAVKRGIG